MIQRPKERLVKETLEPSNLVNKKPRSFENTCEYINTFKKHKRAQSHTLNNLPTNPSIQKSFEHPETLYAFRDAAKDFPNLDSSFLSHDDNGPFNDTQDTDTYTSVPVEQ